MPYICDFHIHSKHSRGCSTNLDLKNLEKYARIKGIDVLGTGDFTHPLWVKELKESLDDPHGEGILQTKTGFPFLLQTEISNIYTQDAKGHRIHNLILAPSFEVVEQINEALAKKGRLDYDGRPIFGFSCVELVEMMRSISHDIEVIPAHIWTPWFSLFGSNSGFNTVEACFKDQTKHIHAVETGMSSDPAMNWRLSQLDTFNLVSFSDSHSYWPWRLGREATIFETPLNYKEVLHALRTGEGIVETIEVDPNYGKYHFTGHRACDICFSPAESKKHHAQCPKCGKQLTVGVMERVEELADHSDRHEPKNRKPFKTLLPLSEILASMLGKGLATQAVWKEYYTILKAGTNEFDILLKTPLEKLKQVTHEKIADAILANREGKIKVMPGYDGVYGQLVLNHIEEHSAQPNHKNKIATQKQGLHAFL